MNTDSENLLVHIGHHKTGTTWLQKNLFSHRDRGFHPLHFKNEAINPGSKQAKRIGRKLLRPNDLYNDVYQDYKELKSFLDRECRFDAGLVNVLSSEGLSGVGRRSYLGGMESARAIKEIFPNARILIGIREQRSALLSLYFQYLRMGGTLPAGKFLKLSEITSFPRSLNYYKHEYHYLILKYQELFGRQNVFVYTIEEWQSSFAGFLLNFRKFLDLDHPIEQYAGIAPENTKLKPLTLEVSRRLSPLLYSVEGNAYSSLGYITSNNRVEKFLTQLDRLMPRPRSGVYKDRFVAAIPGKFLDAFAKSNRVTSSIIDKDLSVFGYLQ